MRKLPDRVHFTGIGGAGMAPLGEILLRRGARVTGTDRELTDKTARLVRLGATIREGHDAAALPDDCELLVYSSAVPPENPEWVRAAALGIPQMRRGEFLALLAGCYARPVAVSGSHGKSTITAMLVHILLKCGLRPGFLIGAAVNGGDSAAAGEGDDLFVMEVDESDGTHTLVNPHLGIVPNVEDDHSWSVGGEQVLMDNFRQFGRNSRALLYYRPAVPPDFFRFHPAAEALEFPAGDRCGDWLGFQAWNAALAVRAAIHLGVAEPAAMRAIQRFPGVARRMNLRHDGADFKIIEDYAHHPTELACSIAALRQAYPDWHLRVVFQPHRYQRLQKYMDAFATELRQADSVVITPVFAAWSECGPQGGAELAAAIGSEAVYAGGEWEAIARVALDGVARSEKKPVLLAVLGAGDISRIFPCLEAQLGLNLP